MSQAVFSSEFDMKMKRLNSGTAEQVGQKVLELASGQRPASLTVHESVSKSVWVDDVAGWQLVFTVGLQFEDEIVQVLEFWDVVDNKDTLNEIVNMVGEKFSTYTSEYHSRCNKVTYDG